MGHDHYSSLELKIWSKAKLQLEFNTFSLNINLLTYFFKNKIIRTVTCYSTFETHYKYI